MSKTKKSNCTPEFSFDIEKFFDPSYFGKLPVWQKEIFSFYSRRLHSYSKIPEELAECRDSSDVFALQSKFFAELISDYQNEAAVITELLVDQSRSVEERNNKPTQANHDEAILKAEKDAEHLISLAKNQAETIIEAAEARAASIINTRKKSKKVA